MIKIDFRGALAEIETRFEFTERATVFDALEHICQEFEVGLSARGEGETAFVVAIAGIRNEAPELEVVVRLSVADRHPYSPSASGVGEPTGWQDHLPYDFGFGADRDDPRRFDLDEPFRMGIGIYAGPAIVGEMGYGAATGITAIGDAVNTASRLETMTKEFQAQLVVSQDVAERADIDLSAYPRHEIEVRGREEPVAVRVIDSAGQLPI